MTKDGPARTLLAFVETHRGLFTAISLFTALAAFSSVVVVTKSEVLARALTFVSLCTAGALWLELLRGTWSEVRAQLGARVLDGPTVGFAIGATLTAVLLFLVLAAVNEVRAFLLATFLVVGWALNRLSAFLNHSALGQRIWKDWDHALVGVVLLTVILGLGLFIVNAEAILHAVFEQAPPTRSAR